MSYRFMSRYSVAFLGMLFLGLAQCSLPRAVAEDTAQKLVLVEVGNGKTSLGHDISFRLYKAPDGTIGRVDFTTFGSLQAAEKQIEEWIKRVTTIKGRERYDDESSHGFNDRLLAEWKPSTDQGPTLVVIIRRNRFSCYHIESRSMEVAKQIEQLIDVAPDKISSRP